MPANYYCPDNFFNKMTDLDSPRKNNDCYFYYYSTCAKGDSCTFRHEPSALGCETMCSFWKEGKCLNVHCNFRHMELRKNRKAIQCYWETQPGGCLKPHCPFLHQSRTAKPTDIDDTTDKKASNMDCSQTAAVIPVHKKGTSNSGISNDLGQTSDKNYKNNPVDSLVVNFEEESDNESAPSFSPLKTNNRVVKVKTLEEIKLEKIQAESAAYYSYPGVEQAQVQIDNDDLRQRILNKMRQRNIPVQFAQNPDEHAVLPETRKRSLEFNMDSTLEEHIQKHKKQKVISKKSQVTVDTIKIKTLAEIRAERMRKCELNEPDSQSTDNVNCRLGSSMDMDSIKKLDDNEVSSTIRDETIEMKLVSTSTDEDKSRKRIKLKRPPSLADDSDSLTQMTVTPNEINTVTNDTDRLLHEMQTSDQIESDLEKVVEKGDSYKTMDEVLLLEDDDDFTNVSLTGEDELLDDIDELLEG